MFTDSGIIEEICFPVCEINPLPYPPKRFPRIVEIKFLLNAEKALRSRKRALHSYRNACYVLSDYFRSDHFRLDHFRSDHFRSPGSLPLGSLPLGSLPLGSLLLALAPTISSKEGLFAV